MAKIIPVDDVEIFSTNSLSISCQRSFEDVEQAHKNETKGLSKISIESRKEKEASTNRSGDHPVNKNSEIKDDHVSFEVIERKTNEDKADKRYELFKSIMLGQPTNFKWIELIFGLSGIVLVTFILTIPLTLIPYHDLVNFPECTV